MSGAELKILARQGNNALKSLRRSKHNKGLPFMINASELPNNQCYLEYSDGQIALVAITPSNDRDFIVIRKLSLKECDQVRRKHALV